MQKIIKAVDIGYCDKGCSNKECILKNGWRIPDMEIEAGYVFKPIKRIVVNIVCKNLTEKKK